jgi:hypothetical protein
MRPVFGLILALLLASMPFVPVTAQSVMDNLPPEGADEPADTPPPPPVLSAETFTVKDVNADVTADNASHARDQALMQAERSALSQLYTRMGATDVSAKLSDDAVALLVQSFEVQSEKQSSVRYIGVFTIHFKPAATAKKIGKSAPADAAAPPPAPGADKPMPMGPVAHLMVTVQTDSLAAWTQIKRRLNTAPPVAHVDVIDLGRGTSHIDLSYGGTIPDLQNALTDQGLVLRQVNNVWQLYDGSMVPR